MYTQTVVNRRDKTADSCFINKKIRIWKIIRTVYNSKNVISAVRVFCVEHSKNRKKKLNFYFQNAILQFEKKMFF